MGSSMVDDFLGNERTTGKLEVNGSVNGTLQRGYDEDWFAVTLEAGVTYYLTGTNPGNTGFGIAFFDPRRDAVAAMATGDQEPEYALEFTPAASGTYYAMAVDLAGNFALTDYTLHLAARSKPDDFPATPASSGMLAVGTPLQGSFEQKGDVDWIKFHAEAGYHYAITAAGTPYDIALYDMYGRRMDDYAHNFDPTATGDYYVAVTGRFEGNYTLGAKRWSDDFAAAPATTGRLANGATVTGKVEYERDADWLRVDLEQGKVYSFTLKTEHEFVWAISLLDQAGEQLGRTAAIVRNGSYLQLVYQATSSGTAYLQVDQDYDPHLVDVAKEYQLSLATAVDDIGQDAASARELAIGATAQGSMQIFGDRDAFKARLEAGVTYRFSLSANGAGDFIKLELSGANGGPVLAAKQVGSDGSLEFTPNAAGDYLVTVVPESGVTPNLPYALKAERATDDWSANATGAGALAIGASATGRFENTADRDWFAARLDAGATYWFGATISGYGGGALRILDGNGQLLKEYQVPYYQPDLLSFRAEASGTYYIEMSSSHQAPADYTVSASIGTADDSADTMAGAATHTAGTPIERRLEVGTDRDVFKFDVSAGRTYVFNLEAPAFSSIHAQLTDASGKAPAGLSFANGSQIVYKADAGGAVYVTASGRESGSYRLNSQVIEDDNPDTAGPGARLLGEGSSIGGRLEHGLDHDVFRAMLDVHRSYEFRLASGTAGFPPPAVAVHGSGNVVQTLVNGERIVKVSPYHAGEFFIEVQSGNGQATPYTISALPFAGDGRGPFLVAQSHADHATGIALTERTITLKFSEAIQVDTSAIELRDSQGNKISAAYGAEQYPMVSGDTLVFKAHSYFEPGTYTLSLPGSSIHDKDGNRYSGPQTLTFTTVLPLDQPGSGNGLYVAKPGSVIDGGAGTDTFSVDGSSAFTFVLPDGGDFVVWNMLSGAHDRLRNIERLQFPDQVYALDVDGTAGQAYRLYQAAFDRQPDQAGLGFWIQQMDKGVSLNTVAQAFVGSAEFTSKYGAAQTDSAFIQAIYQNVLHRAPDGEGFNFWNNAMQAGVSRQEVLVHFSESAENKEALAGVIGSGFTYLHMYQS